MVAADSKDTDPGLSWLMHVETPPIPLRIVPGLEVLILGLPDGVEANTADDVYGSRDWAALLQMRAMLAFKELPRDFSLIYFNINGVISFPDILRFVAASETASSRPQPAQPEPGKPRATHYSIRDSCGSSIHLQQRSRNRILR